MDASPRQLLAVTDGKRLQSDNGTMTHGRRVHSGNGRVTHGRRLHSGNDRVTHGRRFSKVSATKRERHGLGVEEREVRHFFVNVFLCALVIPHVVSVVR